MSHAVLGVASSRRLRAAGLVPFRLASAAFLARIAAAPGRHSTLPLLRLRRAAAFRSLLAMSDGHLLLPAMVSARILAPASAIPLF